MADTKRDEYMRVTGSLLAAVNCVEQVNVPTDQRRIRELVEVGKSALNKAMLAMWEEAYKFDSGKPTEPGK